MRVQAHDAAGCVWAGGRATYASRAGARAAAVGHAATVGAAVGDVVAIAPRGAIAFGDDPTVGAAGDVGVSAGGGAIAAAGVAARVTTRAAVGAALVGAVRGRVAAAREIAIGAVGCAGGVVGVAEVGVVPVLRAVGRETGGSQWGRRRWRWRWRLLLDRRRRRLAFWRWRRCMSTGEFGGAPGRGDPAHGAAAGEEKVLGAPARRVGPPNQRLVCVASLCGVAGTQRLERRGAGALKARHAVLEGQADKRIKLALGKSPHIRQLPTHGTHARLDVGGKQLLRRPALDGGAATGQHRSAGRVNGPGGARQLAGMGLGGVAQVAKADSEEAEVVAVRGWAPPLEAFQASEPCLRQGPGGRTRRAPTMLKASAIKTRESVAMPGPCWGRCEVPEKRRTQQDEREGSGERAQQPNGRPLKCLTDVFTPAPY